MLTDKILYDLARSRFQEAKILLDNKKPDGAVYLCGYALEFILKWSIVKILEWEGYYEGDVYKSFKTHNLDALLRFAGLEKKIQANTEIFAQWQIVRMWNSEIRYKEIGKVSETEAKDMLEATRKIIIFVRDLFKK